MLMWLQSNMSLAVDTRAYGVISFGSFKRDDDMALWQALVSLHISDIFISAGM